MHLPSLTSPIALAVLLTVALSGCVPTASEPATPAIDPDALASVQELRDLPFDESKVAIVASALGAAGVAIADAWDPGDSAIVRITPWQMQNMAIEAANEGGVSGAELDAISPAPEGSAPIGYIISAWAIDYDSDAARLAHALLGEQDFHHPETILFPGLVTSLFLADATAGMDATDHPVGQALAPGAVTIAPAVLHGVAAPCTAAADFIQTAIGTLFNALTVDTSGGGLLGFLGKVWNTVVNLAFNLVDGLVKIITQPIVNLIVTVLTAVETIRQVSTYLSAWRSTLTPEPETNRFGIADEQVRGAVTLTVLDNRLPIPGPVIDCADLFKVDLRDAGSAAGSTVAWTPTNMARADLSVTDTSASVLDKDQKAEYHYVTGQESAKVAKEGDEHAGLLKVASSVHRNDIERVRKLFRSLLFDQIPPSIRGIVESVAGPILDAATNHLTSITDVRSTGYVAITFHGDKPKPTSVPTTVPGTGAGAASCPTGLLAWLNSQAANADGTVSAIAPAQFVSDYQGALPDLTDGLLPTCAFQYVFDSGVGSEFGYFVGAGKPLLQHALGVMSAAGYEGDTTSTGGFLMDADGRQCAAVFVPRESAGADPQAPFPDQFVEITGPPIRSL